MSTTPDVVITREPTGNVTAEGGDELAFTLLKRAGFVIETAPFSFWYRLPWDMGEKRENQMASHAARMLTVVGYRVELDPGLDLTRITTPTDPLGTRVYGQQILSLTDQLNGAETYAGAADLVEHVVAPDDGVLVRLGEFFEAAAVQANVADTDAGWDLSHLCEDAAATLISRRGRTRRQPPDAGARIAPEAGLAGRRRQLLRDRPTPAHRSRARRRRARCNFSHRAPAWPVALTDTPPFLLTAAATRSPLVITRATCRPAATRRSAPLWILSCHLRVPARPRPPPAPTSSSIS